MPDADGKAHPARNSVGSREREAVSQSVFAHYLNFSKSLVSKWERGAKKPEGASVKLNLMRTKGLKAIA